MAKLIHHIFSWEEDQMQWAWL